MDRCQLHDRGIQLSLLSLFETSQITTASPTFKSKTSLRPGTLVPVSPLCLTPPPLPPSHLCTGRGAQAEPPRLPWLGGRSSLAQQVLARSQRFCHGFLDLREPKPVVILYAAAAVR